MTMLTTTERILSTRETDDNGLDRCEIVVLLFMVTYSDTWGEVCATAAHVANRTGYARPRVTQAIQKLVRLGYLTKQARQSVYRVPDEVALPQDPDARGIA